MSYGVAEQREAREWQSSVKQGKGRAVRCSEMRRRGNVWLSKGKAATGKAAALFGNAAATERKDMRGLAKAKQRNERPCKGMAKKRDALQWYGIALMCEGKAVKGVTVLRIAEADRKKG